MGKSNGAAAEPRVVIDPSGHHLLNHGDTAMLQAAVKRLLDAWPRASIGVITSNPGELARHVPGAHPIPAAGRYEVIDRGPPLAARRDRMVEAAAGATAATVERALGTILSDDGHRYLSALAQADLFVVSGRGGVCDAFPEESRHLLDEMQAAADMGVRTVMMGQGLGPIDDPMLLSRARDVLPEVECLALREGGASLPLALSLGVPEERLAVTGDDALDRVVTIGAKGRARSGVGVNLRFSDYAELHEADVDRVGRVLRSSARELATELVPVPISTYPEEADAATIRRLMGGGSTEAAPVEDPDAAIRRAAECRVVVTGSYHAGVFALGQGVPVVGLARSPYYVDKLNGLAHQFDGGATVLSLDDPDLERQLEQAIEHWWDAPESELEPLVPAALRQVDAARAFWGRLPALVERPGAANRVRPMPLGGRRGMVVEDIEVHELDGVVERSAMFRWPGAERRVSIAVPADLAGDPEDASPFLPIALLPAMRRGDDLTVDGPVSPQLLRGVAQATELYGAWAPELRRPAIEVAEQRAPDGQGAGIASFFSRGIDSTYTAAVPREYPGPIERLLFVRGLDPNLSEPVMAEEVLSARANADRLGLPLAVLTTNVHDLARLFVSDWEDMVGAALALAGLAAAGGARSILIPASDSAMTLGPVGTSPALDHLFSTEATSLIHDSVAHGRVGKGLWLARTRPDLLADLKVCYSEDRADNCGRCGKCLLTMATLRAAGELGAASQFPDTVDLGAVRDMRLRSLQPRIEVAELVRELEDGRDPDLREALLHALSKPMAPYPGPPPPHTSPSFRMRHSGAVLSVMRDRLPWPPPAPHAAPPGLGLVRVLDPVRQAHVYGVGHVPGGRLVGELGSLPRDTADGLDPVYISENGHLVTDATAGHTAPARPAAGLRWAAAPLAWRGAGIGREARARAVAGRMRWLLRRIDTAPGARLARVASIHRNDAPGRLPLFSALHPVTGDQLLTTNGWEPNDLGYAPCELLGYLDAQAPVTGRLGIERHDIPWASRFGRRVRPADGSTAAPPV
ncbi:MAG: hypothetical protein QOD53_1131, partial [Thermoleophilaceae bacterium]|nr:hypothetical protein [Thermoleophilaceae bacterium]